MRISLISMCTSHDDLAAEAESKSTQDIYPQSLLRWTYALPQKKIINLYTNVVSMGTFSQYKALKGN